ncbi:IS66 family transposase [Candidatus Saccharibacteria bacterium]|nr:IS66 family transposase [Candidatus Saccharibacteria bacterium]
MKPEITLPKDEKGVVALIKENACLRESNAYLEEQVEWYKRQIFGKRSEKIVKNLNESQLLLDGFGDLENTTPEEKQKVPAHDRRKSNRDGKDKIQLSPDLPVERQVIDIPEEEKVCSETGKPLVKIGEEITLKLAHKPGSYFIKEIVRPKYALPQESSGGIKVASLPEGLLVRCQADESFLADILTKKFADHLPLYRQQEILSREGIKISRQTMSLWVNRVGLALEPLYKEMVSQILASGNVFIDETPVDMLDPGKGKTHQAYMWVMCGGKQKDPCYRVYDFYTNRKHANVEKILQGYNEVLHSDKYGAYEALANAKKIIWCPCWVHIRRKFFEAETGDPDFRAWALRKIRYLFMLENVAWARSEEERLRIRQDIEIPIIDELITKIKSRLVDGKLLPKSKFREALGYFCGLIPHLKNYTNHAFARLDNNVAERAVRPLAIGRKNWLFVGSEDGGKASAIIYSLVQTCRAVGANPREYLEDIMRRLMSHNSQKLHELLPDQWLMSYRPKP